MSLWPAHLVANNIVYYLLQHLVSEVGSHSTVGSCLLYLWVLAFNGVGTIEVCYYYYYRHENVKVACSNMKWMFDRMYERLHIKYMLFSQCYHCRPLWKPSTGVPLRHRLTPWFSRLRTTAASVNSRKWQTSLWWDILYNIQQRYYNLLFCSLEYCWNKLQTNVWTIRILLVWYQQKTSYLCTTHLIQPYVRLVTTTMVAGGVW